MNNPNSQNSIKDSVLKTIESGRVKMLPKWKFVLRTSLMIVGVVLIALTALYLASFIVFMLRQSGALFAPGFGYPGVKIFLTSLPWVLIGASILFIILLETLVKHYSFAYGRPLLYSVFGVLALVITGGVVIGFSPLHEQLFERAEMGKLPFGGSFYHQFGQAPNNVTVGMITKLIDDGCTMRAREDKLFTVLFTDDTTLPTTALKIGDIIEVLGTRQGTTIHAEGVQKPSFLPPPPHGPKYIDDPE